VGKKSSDNLDQQNSEDLNVAYNATDTYCSLMYPVIGPKIERQGALYFNSNT